MTTPRQAAQTNNALGFKVGERVLRTEQAIKLGFAGPHHRLLGTVVSVRVAKLLRPLLIDRVPSISQRAPRLRLLA